jgi:hypothetical protein
MTWLQRYRVRHDVANAIGILPLLSRVAAIGAVPFFHWIEEAMGWESGLPPGTGGGRRCYRTGCSASVTTRTSSAWCDLDIAGDHAGSPRLLPN